jgi:hypothetical protein
MDADMFANVATSERGGQAAPTSGSVSLGYNGQSNRLSRALGRRMALTFFILSRRATWDYPWHALNLVGAPDWETAQAGQRNSSQANSQEALYDWRPDPVTL